MKKMMALAMVTTMVLGTVPAAAKTQTFTATPSGQTITLNGEKVDFAAYNINGNNYFKLRDLAAAMDGTEKNFNVDYNQKKDSVEITSLTPYTTGNAGISGYPAKGKQVAVNSPQTMYLDGDKVTLQAYAVCDYNYCKLRDVAELLDFAVDWDGNKGVVNIGTDRDNDESVTVQKPEKPATNPTTPSNPSLDISTQQAVKDITAAIGPGSAEYGMIDGRYDQKDWEQLVNNPYSSPKLSIFFDEYKTYGNLEGFKARISGWLRNGGDDGVAHGTVFG